MTLLYNGLLLCGENLGRDAQGLNRICYGKPNHNGSHGNDSPNTGTDWGQAELRISDADLKALSPPAVDE